MAAKCSQLNGFSFSSYIYVYTQQFFGKCVPQSFYDHPLAEKPCQRNLFSANSVRACTHDQSISKGFCRKHLLIACIIVAFLNLLGIIIIHSEQSSASLACRT
eukprot:c22954_g2_i1 orf=449-757(+)